MDWREKIAEARKKSGLTQAELGKLLGIGQQAVGKWESGRTVPEFNQLVNISKRLNVSLDWLLDEERAEPVELEREVRNLLRELEPGEIRRRLLTALPEGRTVAKPVGPGRVGNHP